MLDLPIEIIFFFMSSNFVANSRSAFSKVFCSEFRPIFSIISRQKFQLLSTWLFDSLISDSAKMHLKFKYGFYFRIFNTTLNSE